MYCGVCSATFHRYCGGIEFGQLVSVYALYDIYAQGLPTSATFKVYHLEHHQFQGVQGLDMDVPTQLEAMIFRGVLGKLAFVILQVRGNLHYSARCSGE